MRFCKYLIFNIAALFALCLVADDSIIVMDRAYYQLTADQFYSRCGQLYNDINHNLGVDTSDGDSSIYGRLSIVSSSLQTLQYDASSLYIDLLRISQNSDIPVVEQQSINQAADRAQALSSSAQNMNQQIYEIRGDVLRVANSLRSQIVAVSNSFPTVISSTNLNIEIYVVVTNNFELSTNSFNDVQESYTNFLNYYRGIEDQVLDQYRATVTNLLDQSNLPSWVDYSLWRRGGGVSSSAHNLYNFAFADVPWNVTSGNDIVFNSGFPAIRTWSNYAYRLPTNYSYIDYLNFNLQGIHDSAEYGTRAILQVQNLLITASTNSAITYKRNSSTTNALASFLSAPSTYGEQVYKISQTENYFQRIEHWLSAIAFNTSKSTLDQPDESSLNERNELINTTTNDVVNAMTPWKEDITEMSKRMTNAVTMLDQIVKDITMPLNVFSDKQNGGGSGFRGAGSRFSRVAFMDVHPLMERVSTATGKSISNAPDYIMLEDVNGLHNAWSTSFTLADTCHIIMGFIWFLISFGILLVYLWFTGKSFIVLWLELIKFVPNVARFALGGNS